jgi:hypothetical protein
MMDVRKWYFWTPITYQPLVEVSTLLDGRFMYVNRRRRSALKSLIVVHSLDVEEFDL